MTFFSLADEIERLRDDISILRIHCAFAQLMPWQRGNIAFSYINPTVNIRIIPLTKRESESLTYSKSEVFKPALALSMLERLVCSRTNSLFVSIFRFLLRWRSPINGTRPRMRYLHPTPRQARRELPIQHFNFLFFECISAGI
jgi:hypothetical protein